MIKIFFLTCIIELIIQIILIVKFKKHSDSKHWAMFIGINGASLISLILYEVFGDFSKYGIIGIGGAFILMIMWGFFLISNLILFIIGIFENIKKKNNKNKKDLKFLGIFLGMLALVILLNAMILIALPSINNKIKNDLISENTITYLKEKYGIADFEIINIEDDYSYDGILTDDLIGYKLVVSSPLLKKNFIVNISGSNPKNANGFIEGFIEEYYKEKVNEYLSHEYNLEFDIWVEEDAIPDNFGHIPTFDELVEYNAIKNIFIIAKKTNKSYIYDADEEERISYLKKLSLNLKDYLNISKTIDFEFQRWLNENSYQYNIQIQNNTIKITDNSGKTYEFNTDN